ncbi:MAG TPA: CdaR family protein [Thermoanaerobaculia bacterium]|nr:CdaR family protein [Thermoanaerobaculia bacterium]
MNLSRVLFRNAGTKLLALAIAAATWYVLTGQRRERISERNYRVPLAIVNVPRGTMIVSPLPDAVDVRVRGAFTPMRALDPAKLEAVVDLADASPGEKRYPLGPGDINVPEGIEVIALTPSEVRLVLDAVAERILPISASLSGEPLAGASVEEVSVEPKNARILGPAKTLARLSSLPTQPVSIEGRDASFTETTTLVLPAPGVRVREGQLVGVHVKIRPAPAPEPTPKPTPGRTRKGKS